MLVVVVRVEEVVVVVVVVVLLFLRGVGRGARFVVPTPSLGRWERATWCYQCGWRQLLGRIGEIGGGLRGSTARN